MKKFFTEFKSLRIKNALMFKNDIEIPLSNQGIISVIGINKDANGSNGAGKSTIFDIIRAIHLGASADGRKDIDFLSNKGASSIGYTARYGKDVYEITKHRGDKTFGNNTIILKNGESVGFKKDNNATKKSIYQEFVKIPEAVFDNCVVLRTDKAHTLIRGTPSERIEFISNLCSLNCYDEVNKLLKEKLANVTDKIDSLRENEALLADVSNTLSNLKSRVEVEAEVAQKNKEVEELEEKIKSKEDKLKKNKKINDACCELVRLNGKIEDSETSSKEDEKELNDKKEELSSLKDKIEVINDELSSYKTYNELKQNPIGTKGNIDEIESSIKNISSKIENLEPKVRENIKYKELKQKIKKLNELNLDSEEILSKKESKLSQRKIQLEILSHLAGHKFGVCPVCGSNVSSDSMKLDKKEIEQELHSVIESLTNISDDKLKLNKLNSLNKEIKEYTYTENAKEDIEKLEDKKTALQKELTEAIKYKDYQKKLSSIKEKLSNDEDKLLEKKEKLSERKQELEEYISNAKLVISRKKEIEDIEQKFNISRNDAENLLDETNEKISELSISISKKREKLSSKTKELGKLEESLDNITTLINKKNKLERSLEDLPKLKKRKDFISNLCVAYSVNGLKAKKISAILEALKVRLKEYTAVLFSEKDIDFDIKGDNSRFSIMCIRKDENGNEICRYDVRSLSGGEKARFVLAIVFALDDITSPSMKVNFKVLDEIDAKLDSVGKQILIERFIPMLKEKTSTLFIVSHDTEVRDANIYDARLIVKKKNRVSSIKLERLKDEKI